MSEIKQDQAKREAIARIDARLETVLQVMRENEAKLLADLELGRLRRRLAAQDSEKK